MYMYVNLYTNALRLLALRGWRTLILVLKSISLKKTPNLLIFKILMSTDDVIAK